MTAKPLPPLLILAVGNPSRGDDALGPALLARVESALKQEIACGAVELLTDFQLQVEHVLDLQGRRAVIFVDASVAAAAPFEWLPATPQDDDSFSTHALSPQAVLAAHARWYGPPPPAQVLAIAGHSFELGDSLSAAAQHNLDAAFEALMGQVRAGAAITVTGVVQGVGFRPWLTNVARELGLRGAVKNDESGVSIEAFGPRWALDALVTALHREAPPAARIATIHVDDRDWQACEDFIIGPSSGNGATLLAIPPDLGLCTACAQELDDPTDRRFAYAFSACTACGPRYSVVDALPYDRARTSLSDFPLCQACLAQYRDASDRRFHAEAIACPSCGPRASLHDSQGEWIPCSDPVAQAAEQLRQGQIVAVQGLGGVHLACCADDDAVVARLRTRKRRDAKPLAVLCVDVAAAEAVARLDESLRAALVSPARPITLAPLLDGQTKISAVVTDGSTMVGLMLPYTPLHRRLAALVGRPLVLTSGNVSGAPIAVTHAEAFTQLHSIADFFLLHDRPIRRRVEDGVVGLLAGQVRTLRRARGFVPLPVRLPLAAPEPVLAWGGHGKHTACVVVGDRAYLTPHLGDLDHPATEAMIEREIGDFLGLLGVQPQVVAGDLHPDYVTTRLAAQQPAHTRVPVQHHVAHVLAVTAEMGITGPVLGLALDGAGWGPDGTAWGSELLYVHGVHWHRLATVRPLPLVGGEAAIRQTWRAAVGALYTSHGDQTATILHDLKLFGDVAERELRAVQQLAATGIQTVPARGTGRWFDAVGALLLNRSHAAFDGAVAIALEDLAAHGEAAAFPYRIEALADGVLEIDLRPLLVELIAGLQRGDDKSLLAQRFHATWLAAWGEVIDRVWPDAGAEAVVLCGGAMQNRRLAAGLHARLARYHVQQSRDIPCNDGGLSLGQAWAAVLALHERGADDPAGESACASAHPAK